MCRLRLETCRPGEIGKAVSLLTDVEAECPCIGEEPEGRRRLPRTWATEPEGGTGLGVEDSMFTVEAGAGWADRAGRSSGEEGLGAEKSVLAEG